MNKPFFSIVIPLFNKEKYIISTLDSIKNQIYKNYEIIIVDNGSFDNGFKLAKVYAKKHPNIIIKLLRDNSKSGPGFTRNVGLENANGNWILFLDSDDLLERNYLNNKYKLCITGRYDIVAGNWIEMKEDKYHRIDSRMYGITSVEDYSIAYVPWILHAAVISMNWIKKHNIKWDEAFDGYLGEDLLFWYKMTYGASIGWTKDFEAIYRILDDKEHRNLTDSEKWIFDIYYLLQKNISWTKKKNVSISRRKRVELSRVFENLYIKNSKYENSLENDIKRSFIKEAFASRHPGLMLKAVLGIKTIQNIRFQLKKYSPVAR